MHKILIFIIFFISCNKNRDLKTSQLIDVDSIKVKEDTTFKYRYKNEPKIFLKFWKGMDYATYSRVCDSLKKDDILDNEIYKTDDCKIKILPNFINDSLYSIYFTSNIECIYDLYVEKYKIPQMKEKSSLIYYYRENNPTYSPEYFYEIEGVKKRLPDCFNDKSNFVKAKIKMNTNVNWAREKFIPKDTIIIKNGDVVIKLKQEILEGMGNKDGNYKYSITESQDFKDFSSTPEGEETLGLFSTFTSNSIGKYISVNSKTRTKYGTIYPSLTIEYLMQKDYLKEKNKLQMKLVKKEIKKDFKFQRRTQVKNEI